MAEEGLVDVPRLGAEVADTHAHLDMLEDPAGALERAAIAGVSLVLAVVDVTEAPEQTFDGLAGWLEQASARLAERGGSSRWTPPQVRMVVGCHPHNAKDFDRIAEERLRALARDPRVGAVGETGLDFHYDHSPRDDQRRAFHAQLAIAREDGLPAVVHLREAHEEGAAILEEEGVPGSGCVIHCFTGETALAERFVEMGCHISFAGPTTFKKAETIREAAAAVPLDRLLVETDCPFLAPAPYRGKANEPALVTLTAAAIAATRGIADSDLAMAVSENAHRLFGADSEE